MWHGGGITERDVATMARRIVDEITTAVLVWARDSAQRARGWLLWWANAAAERAFLPEPAAPAPAKGHALTLRAVLPGVSEEALAAACGAPGVVPLGDLQIRTDRVYAAEAIGLGSERVALLLQDVTEARAASRELARTVRELQDLYEHAPVGHHSLDPEGVFVRINHTLLEWLGYAREELIGKKRLTELLTPESAARFTDAFATFQKHGTVRDLELDAVRKDGTLLPISWSATAVRDEHGRFVQSRCTLIDLRERRAALAAARRAYEEVEAKVAERTTELARANEELRRAIAERERALEALARSHEQLRQAEKMEAIGRLACGIVHDFNNMVSAILGFTQMVAETLPPGDPRRDDLEQANAAAHRAAVLSHQLLAFCRRRVRGLEPLDVDATLRELEKMLRRLIREDIALVTCFASGAQVLANRGDLEQIVMNLAINARDAMPGGGTLTIETTTVEFDESSAREHDRVEAGAYVMIVVSDTGCGIRKETIDRIFEPFFTTKEPERGTGLGLATVHRIVEQARGCVRVESWEGRGTTFKVYLPVLAGTRAARTSSTPPSASPGGVGRPETILLVEDEELVRSMLLAALRRAGYTVVAPRTADEALAHARGAGPIDLVLTDVVMPGMNGIELVTHIRQARPGVPVIFMSGHAEVPVLGSGIPSDAPFLEKPVTPAQLERTLRAFFGARPGRR
jgi:PAS domain S-box-containing protein